MIMLMLIRIYMFFFFFFIIILFIKTSTTKQTIFIYAIKIKQYYKIFMLIKIKNRKIYNDVIDIYLKKILILNLDIELCW